MKIRAMIWCFEGALVRTAPGPALPLRGADEPLRDVPTRLAAFAVVSRRSASETHEALARLGWASRFSVVIGADEVASPDGAEVAESRQAALELALRRLDRCDAPALSGGPLSPSEVLVVAGLPDDVIAARKAGLRVAALTGSAPLPLLGTATFIVSHPGAVTDLFKGLR